jgi:hypothetical protein
MTNRLIRFETWLLRRSFGDAFSGARDRLLLLVIAALAALWARAHFADAAVLELPERAAWAGALGLPAGFAAHRLLAGRLAWLAEESPLSAVARQGRARRAYLALFHGLFAVGVTATAVWIGIAAGKPILTPVLALTSYAAGATLGTARQPDRGVRRVATDIARPPGRRFMNATGSRAMFRTIVAHQTRDRDDPIRGAALLLGLVFAATLGAGSVSGSWTGPARIAAMVAPALLALAWTSRVEVSLLGFLPSLGYGPAATGFAVSALPLGCVAAALLAIAVVHAPVSLAAAAIAAAAGVGLILVGLARTWLSPGRSGRSVDLQVEIEVASALLIGFSLPPLAPAIVLVRLGFLYRAAAARRWAQP